MSEFEKFRDLVLEKEKQGKVVITTVEGYVEIGLDEIIKQPTEGLLYDLNRDRATILSWIDDRKWVNDFACMKVIERLKAIIDRLVREQDEAEELERASRAKGIKGWRG